MGKKQHTRSKAPASEPAAPPPAAPLTQFGQFRILPVTMPSLLVANEPLSSFANHERPATTPVTVEHHLFIRPHEPRKVSPGLPNGRTLFVVNIPSDATIRHFSRLFRRCGKLESIVWQEGSTVNGVHRSGSQAHVVFEDEEGLERAVALKTRRRVWSDEVDEDASTLAVTPADEDDEGVPSSASAEQRQREQQPQRRGLTKWVAQHFESRPRLAQLQLETDTTLVAFEDAEREARLAIEDQRNVPDEDGFVTVVRGRGRKNTNMDGQGASVSAARPEDLKKLKPKKKELVDFYRFQMRETKRNQLADLRRKFEEDKERIVALRANRRFKPY
ncbi:Ribosomal RNA-processing protein 7 A [Thoreauomyces humboldtii]|nr:Ribosomal RNA-processing protein 7 A [Thoreauomyces humboldtii]